MRVYRSVAASVEPAVLTVIVFLILHCSSVSMKQTLFLAMSQSFYSSTIHVFVPDF